MTCHPKLKDPSHKEMVEKHLEALNQADERKRNIFEHRVKETGVTHQVEGIDRIMGKPK